jgi:hypothetical protein
MLSLPDDMVVVEQIKRRAEIVTKPDTESSVCFVETGIEMHVSQSVVPGKTRNWVQIKDTNDWYNLFVDTEGFR